MTAVKTKPKVSVIIPTYNNAKYVTHAVESAIDQTYTDYEIIVIDDGSTDNTRNILDPYRDRINYIYQEHQGVSTARNLGIEQAKGELIAFLDADDYFLPEHLAQQTACLENRPLLGMVSSGWYRVDRHGEVLSENKPWQVLPKLNLETWLLSRPVLPTAIMVRKEWLEAVNGFKPELELAQDIDLILRLSLRGCQAQWSKKITSCYRASTSNATNDTIKQAKFFDAVYERFFLQDDLPESVAQLENKARYSYLKWLGWRLYYTGQFSEMTSYLFKSLSYSDYSKTETICNWIEYFSSCSKDEGYKLDAYSLSNLKEWKELMISLYLNSTQLMKLKQGLLVKEIEAKEKKVREYQKLGDEFSKNGKSIEAANYYQKALELQPDAWNIHHKLGHIFFKQKKWNKSIIKCRKVIEIEPDFVWSYYNLGRSLAQLGNWKEAVTYYLKALEISPKLEIQRDLELLLDEKIAYYRNCLQDGLNNLSIYQELLDIKGKIRLYHHNNQTKRSEQILNGFSKKVSQRKKVICLLFEMKKFEFTESINFLLHQMHENKIYPIVFTDSVETELLYKNNVIFEYFPISEKPTQFSDEEWQQYFQNRVVNLIQEWSPQQVLNFNNTLNRKLSHTLLSK